MRQLVSIGDNLSKARWSLDWVSALDREGRTIWIADARRDGNVRYSVGTTDEAPALGEVAPSVWASDLLLMLP